MTLPTHRTTPYDVAVIGAGTAGLVTASGAALLGARTALIERHRFGGECLWTGCVPSKALIRTAQTVRDARRAAELGLEPAVLSFDFDAVMRSMRDVIARIQPHDDPETLRRKGVDPIEGSARIVGPGRIEVNGRDLVARRIVIATGSRPIIPPIEGLSEIGFLTHESLLELRRQPRRLVVIGAGPVGLEFAQVFSRLGSEVTVVELADRILPREDAEPAAALREILEREGIRFLLRHRAMAATRKEDARRLVLEGPGGSRTEISGDELLVATGMRPCTESLGLEKVGAELDERGALRIDAKLRTTARRVWAAGDVTGVLFFTHVAEYQARLVVRNMFFPFPASADYALAPRATFTDPPLAGIGLTEQEARERHGDRVRVFRYPFDDLDRAITDRSARGSVKLVTDSRGRILGAHILGAQADAVIHEVALAMRGGMKVGSLSQLVHVYPTWSEGLRRAADGYYRDKLSRGWTRRVLRWWVGRR